MSLRICEGVVHDVSVRSSPVGAFGKTLFGQGDFFVPDTCDNARFSVRVRHGRPWSR